MLTANEAGKILGVSDRRIRALIASGKLKAVRFGSSWAIDAEDLEPLKERKPGRPKRLETIPNSE